MWFIPACAGNTNLPSTRTPWQLVHPRVRGEHLYLHGHAVRWSGSSPRARGTSPLNAGADGASVHPRVRGEHVGLASACGSTPRFIPACAGNTLVSGELLTTTFIASALSFPVHPRVRGEHSSRVQLEAVIARLRFIPACAGNTDQPLATDPRRPGSSPRARGTRLSVVVASDVAARFIPACAGNTRSRQPPSRAFGSSPRARGTRISVS